jgi:hypothetical protein
VKKEAIASMKRGTTTSTKRSIGGMKRSQNTIVLQLKLGLLFILFLEFFRFRCKAHFFPPFIAYNLHLKCKPPSYPYMGRDLYPS